MTHVMTSLKRFLILISPGLVCFFIFLLWISIWRRDIRIPFYYSGDGLFLLALIKVLCHNPWYWSSQMLGAPYGFQMFDYPMCDNMHFALMRLIGFFTDNPGLIYNLYYGLTFILIGSTTHWVFQKMKLHPVLAWTGALIYTTTPYHWLRGGHIFLSGYYFVPIACWLVIQFWEWCETGNPTLKRKQYLAVMITLLLMTATGVYYSFFTVYLFLVAGVTTAINQRRIAPLLWSILPGITLGLGAFINLSPSFLFHMTHGINKLVGNRSPVEAELYGLKFFTLFLTTTSYGLKFIAKDVRFYFDVTKPDMNEKYYAYLGLIPLVGFVFLLFKLLALRISNFSTSLLSKLALLNIFLILLCISGGFSSMFNFLISPGIRAYNRSSIFIVFLGLAAVLVLLNHGYQKIARPQYQRVLLSVFVFIAVFDIYATRVWAIDDIIKFRLDFHRNIKAQYLIDEAFFHRIDSLVPENAMILQLPIVPFPENPPVAMMGDYDHFRGIIHSQKNLRWSYGAVRGRESLVWQESVTRYPVDEMVKKLKETGFKGIYINRLGYDDRGQKIVGQLSAVIHEKPITDPANLLVFFKL